MPGFIQCLKNSCKGNTRVISNNQFIDNPSSNIENKKNR